MALNQKTAATLGAIALAVSANAFAAGENPFAIQSLGNGYQVAEHDKAKEGKCGEGKCSAEMKKGKQESCKHDKAKEGKCGEGKCSAEMKASEGKCGGDKAKEGSCKH